MSQQAKGLELFCENLRRYVTGPSPSERIGLGARLLMSQRPSSHESSTQRFNRNGGLAK